jgi:hypothetical protein
MHRQRSWLLGSLLVLVAVCALALGACNSNSVSGSTQKASGATNAAQSTTSTETPASKGLLKVWAARVNNTK